jgi:hypothetical protein
MDTRVRAMEAAEGIGCCGGSSMTWLAGCARARRSRAAQNASGAVAAAVEAGGVPKRRPGERVEGRRPGRLCVLHEQTERTDQGSEHVATRLARLARAHMCAARAKLERHRSRMTMAGGPERERGEAAGGPRWLMGYGSLRVWSGRVRVNGFGPIEIRNGFLNLDNGFSNTIE